MKVTKTMAAKAKAKIDWSRFDATTDEDIAAQVAGNPEAAPLLSDEEVERALFADRLRAIRAALRLSQSAFAERFRIPAASLRDWEQGRRLPDAAMQAYLTVIERNPRAVETALMMRCAKSRDYSRQRTHDTL
jgi:putative transcriptional regulator